jgi:hypothetical protein
MAQTTRTNPDQMTPAGAIQNPASSADLARIKYGAWLIGVAFVLLGVVFGIAVSQFTNAADVTAAVGSVATVVGTIIGAFFGIQAGSSGKEAAEAGRAQAERASRLALAKLDPQDAADVMRQI